jgi:predicted SAM-dependent methyltransferase
VYGSEVIEHITLWEARSTLAEIARVLKPGGVLRLTTPDMKAVLQIYLGEHERTTPETRRVSWLGPEFSPEIWINHVFRGYGHQFVHSFDSLRNELLAAGFDRVERCQPQRSSSGLPQLDGIDLHAGPDAPDASFDATMILEAYAPTR